jgi:hypothetical protein
MGIIPASVVGTQSPTDIPRQVSPKISVSTKKKKPGKRVVTKEIGLVRSFAERTLRFQDLFTRVNTLSGLASVLWKDDQPFARQLFLKGFEAIQLDESTVSNVTNPDVQKEKLDSLRNTLIARATRCDPDLAAQLTTSFLQSDNSEGGRLKSSRSTMFGAGALLENSPKKAIELAEGGLRFGVGKEMRDFLFRLRLRDPVAADRLFARVLDRLTAEPFVDANVLMHLGGYIYIAEGVGPNENGVSLVVVGNQLVVDLSLAHPSASSPATIAYLNAAVDILLRPASDPEQQQLYYIASHQLYPKVQLLLPARASQLAAAMVARASNIPTALTKESTYRQLSSSSREPVNESGEGSRKAESVDLLFEVYAHVERGDYASAESTAAKIEDLEVRGQLINLTKFYKTLKQIDVDIASAAEMAEGLNGSTEQALLFLGIADKWDEMQDTPRALEAVARALKSIRNQDKSNRPLLLLAAASKLSGLNAFSSREIFLEAFRAFDNQDLAVMSHSIRSKTVTMDGVPMNFSLTTKRVETDFKQLINPFVTADCDWTVSTISNVSHEKVLGPAFVAISESLLK